MFYRITPRIHFGLYVVIPNPTSMCSSDMRSRRGVCMMAVNDARSTICDKDAVATAPCDMGFIYAHAHVFHSRKRTIQYDW